MLFKNNGKFFPAIILILQIKFTNFTVSYRLQILPTFSQHFNFLYLSQLPTLSLPLYL